MTTNFKFHHLGIATRNLEKCAEIYRKMGYDLSEIKVEPSQHVKIGFLYKSGNPVVELIEPLIKDSPVSKIIQVSGTTPYHTCYEVDNIKLAVKELEKLNFRSLFEPKESKAMEAGLFCYLFSPDAGLIELYQKDF
jgi:methylmalonyl-CoA/ethylmalonyl-CoA epimerase